MSDTLTNISYQAASESAKQQMDFQEKMSNTAHQREVKDLIAAGLNPILSANAGASSPVGAEGYVTSAKAKKFDEQVAAYELEQKRLDQEHEKEMLKAETDAKLLLNSAKMQAQSVNAITKALSSYSSGKSSSSGSKKSSSSKSNSKSHLNFSTGDDNTDYWLEKILNRYPELAAVVSFITSNPSITYGSTSSYNSSTSNSSTSNSSTSNSSTSNYSKKYNSANNTNTRRGNGMNFNTNPVAHKNTIIKKNIKTLGYADKVGYTAAKQLLY